jgi:hypothetical protein
MPSWLNQWFGTQTGAKPDVSPAQLKITDGDLEVDFTKTESGWFVIGPSGWAPRSAAFKGGGYYANSLMVDGQQLRHTAFDNVVESWQCALQFYSSDGMLFHIDTLEELLCSRAPRYWTDRRYHKPVWLERKLPGESNTAYAFISQGQITLPQDTFDVCTADNGLLTPVLLTLIRSPFWYGAAPGMAQGTAELSARQAWEYQMVWSVETNLPAGYIYCFVETTAGLIYAGGASEILRWWNSSWNAVNTAPAAIAGNITSAVKLANGDLLFGDNGQIIKLSSTDVWSVETSLPTGQVTALVQADNGVVYAGDDKRILKRDAAGTWSVDSTLPLDYVYSFATNSDGRVFAGSEGEILAQVEGQTSSSLAVRIAAATDQAEQYNASVYTDPVYGTDQDLDLFNRNYVALRFSLAIPVGATINSAKIRFQSDRTVTGTSDAARIYCEDADSAGAFARTDYNISTRTLTTAFTPWQDTTKRKRLAFFYSPDFSEAVQEVVDGAAWAANNYLAVIIKCDNLSYSADRSTRRQVQSYDQCSYNCPRLDIEYTPAPAAEAGWEIVSKLPTGDVRSMLLTSGGLMLAGENGRILGSDDQGKNWGIINSTTPTDEIRTLYEDKDGYVWAGDNGNILKSSDGGRNWASDSTVPTGYVEDIIQETSTGDLRAGDNGNILIRDETLQVTLGRTATDEDQVYVANHHKTCNITDIKLSDGGVFQDLFPMSTFPTQLFPNVPAENDALYFGADTSLADTGPFCSLVFDIGIPTRWTTSGSVVWEYYNGATWATLTTQDNTVQFTEAGVNSVTWKQPSAWATVAVDGVTGYWVRARCGAIVGTMVPCTQQNRDIYSAIWPFVELDDAQAAGNIDSLIRLKVHNRSDNGGPGGSEPLLYFNRLLMGAKEYEDHEDFRAFLNFADEQNPTGVSVDVTVDTDSATSIEADSNLSSATGRRVFFDAGIAAAGGGLNNLIDRVEIELDTTVAMGFYGTYLLFLRCKQQGGDAGEVTVRIKVVSGTGGISSLGDIQPTKSTTDHEIIEFHSPITIPVSAQMTDSDIGDTTSIIVQIACAANDADLYLYDLFLLPVDGPWIDAKDTANTAESAGEKGRRLAMDSISVPKAPTRAMVQKLETGAFVSSWRMDGNGPARLIAGKKQRLWILTARTTAAASSTWISEPEYLYTVTVDKTDRWITGRGAA